MARSPEITVIIPMFNEVEVIGAAMTRVAHELESCGHSWEILCVDDGSNDGGPALVAERSREDRRFELIELSRNFGKEGAISAGLQAAAGAAVIVIDADLQHPPELIPKMVEAWRGGAHLVEAVKTHRGKEPVLHRMAAKLFYALMGQATRRSSQGDADFKLLDRQVVDAINELPERNRYFRGLVAWVGFRSVKVPFEVQGRAAGTAKWSLFDLIRYSLRNLIAFSSLPLRLVAWFGFVTVAFGGLLAVQTLVNYLMGNAVEGFTTAIVLNIILSGAILTCLGIVATYVAQMYDEIKGRPTFVVIRRQTSEEEEPTENEGS
jgi:polyisoprenyl-phosphate glycosyltransferase